MTRRHLRLDGEDGAAVQVGGAFADGLRLTCNNR
jgi:hypothetical protein